MNDPVTEPRRDLPVEGEFDVIVCGGGPAGVAAAVAAARAGAATALFELEGYLGGIWTAGLMPFVLDGRNKGGLMREIHKRLIRKEKPVAKLDEDPSLFYPPERSAYDVESAKRNLEQMCTDAGVFLRFYTRVCDAICKNNDIQAVVTESKSGREAWKAHVFVDATGDGDLGARAGCGFDYGRPEAPAEAQPMSLNALITGVEISDIRDYVNRIGDNARGKLRGLINAGGVSPSYCTPSIFHVYDDLFLLMTNHQYGVCGFDAGDLTAASIQARREVGDIIKALRSAGGVWDDLVLVATSAHIGVREGRRIHGRYMLTRKDLEEGARFEDAVCRVTLPVDIHETRKGEGDGREGIVTQPYDIPRRALRAADVDNLFLAGRCISGDFFAHASYRVTGNAVPAGEAAGKAAANMTGH
ncbi:MAG: FAD-dependent oxidoreductase [Planctomycetota bacterium]